MNKATHPGCALGDEEWSRLQVQHYGPLLGGADLRAFLGFRTQAAFAKARATGDLGPPVFSIPGRNGVFAVTTDACSWLLDLRHRGASRDGPSRRVARSGGLMT